MAVIFNSMEPGCALAVNTQDGGSAPLFAAIDLPCHRRGGYTCRYKSSGLHWYKLLSACRLEACEDIDTCGGVVDL